MKAFIVRWLVLLIMLHAFAISAQPLPATILIDPKATYLLVNNDPAVNASPIDLGALGISGGDLLRLTGLGAYDDGTGAFRNGMTGVFSTNSNLLAPSLLNRVPGAVAAGTPYLTFATSSGNLSTDISQDFAIQLPQQPPSSTTNISIRVPPGAAYLFVSAKDKHFSDNVDHATNHFRLLLERGTDALLTVSLASSNSVKVSWNTDSNQWYQVQSSLLLSNDWTNPGPPLLGTGSPIAITNSTFGQKAMYYRLERVP